MKSKKSTKSENKLNLYSAGNEKYFNYYVFDKTKEVHKKLSILLNDCLGLKWKLKKTEYDKKDNSIDVDIDIAKNKDFHETIDQNRSLKLPRADVFYGDKRIFLMIYSSKEQRKKFNDELKKICKMPEPNSDIK